jgi:hypothetical protein
MNSSATQDFLSEVHSNNRISAGTLAYFQTRLATNIHQALLKLFCKLESDRSFTRRELADRIGRKPEQITRWFSYPGNLTLGTVSDICVGMGYELESVTLVNLKSGKRLQCPDRHVDWSRLADLYQREEPIGARLPIGTPRRSALGEQISETNPGAKRRSLDQPLDDRTTRTEFQRSDHRTAATVQLQTTQHVSRTHIGQEA